MEQDKILNLTHYPRSISPGRTLDLIRSLQDVLDFGRAYGFKAFDSDGWDILDAAQDALAQAEEELFPEE